jgi:hypothetical protein
MDAAPRGPLSRSELKEAVQRERALQQQALREKISPVAWLASAPFTTLELASRPGTKNVGDALAALASEGLVRRSSEARAEGGQVGEQVYSMTSAGRTTVLDLYAQPQNQIKKLRSDVAHSAAQMTVTSSVPDSIVRWAELARHANDSVRLIAAFEDRTDAAYKHRDAAALLNWIDTARPLSELLLRDVDDSLQASIQQAGRRLELLHRRAVDERHLTSFLRRDDQVKALRDLVRGPDNAWALHLFGVGGVGKTMLLRYLTGYLAEHEFRAATARIDFDYLNPDYPSLDPGLLLWSFAQELRAYATDQRASDQFDAADQKLQRLRQELTTDGRSSDSRGTDSPLFLDAVVNFVDALKSLDRRVILIVDTCEELAKMRPDGTSPANVAETFRILTALHDGPMTLRGQSGAGTGVPGLRIVFAGRRPLAQRGLGWHCPPSRLAPRPYLRLHELSGFTHDHAREYLHRIMKVPDALVQAVIERSPDIGSSGIIEWDEGGNLPAPVPRCNPYDLRLYADWARETPPPDEQTIRKSTAEQYVELRILRRLETYEPLRRLMPVVALLKYVDEDVVTAALQDGTTAGQAYARLRDQDWIAERRIVGADGTSGRVTLSAEERLRKRLWTYFRDRGGVPRNMLAPILDHFETMASTADLRQLDWVVFDAALRVFEYDQRRGAQWWTAVERRIVNERGYDWLLQVTGSLLAEPNAASRASEDWRPSSLRAAVAAAYLDAVEHSRAPRTPDVTWQDVLDSVDLYPVQEERALLRWRGTVGRIAHAALSPSADVNQLTGLVEPLRSLEAIPDVGAAEWAQAAAATVAAWDALVEFVEGQGGEHSEAWRQFAPLLLGRIGPAELADLFERGGNYELAAYAHSLAMRVAHWARNGHAVQLGERSLACADRIGDERHRWLDWEPPEDVAARVRVEFARTTYPAYLSPAAVMARVTPPSRPTCIDQDRLLAIVRIISGATKAVSGGDTGASLDEFSASAMCAAHRVVPPAAVVMATQAAEIGHVAEALASLNRIIRTGSTGDLTVVRHAQRALASIVVRMRLMEADERVPGALSESPLPSDRGLFWTAASRLGDDTSIATTVPGFVAPTREARAPWLHALWQSRVALGDRFVDAMSWATENLEPQNYQLQPSTVDAASRFDALSEYFDIVETNLVAFGNTERMHPLVQLPQLSLLFRSQPDERLELSLRYIALLGSEFNHPLFFDGPVEEVGVRRAATIAFELGDNLMMRLPERAGWLFEQAGNWFAAADDTTGALLAAIRLAIIKPDTAARAVKAFRAARSLDLPALQLDAAAGKSARDADQQLITAAPPAWRPHLARLAACVYRDLATPPEPAVPFGPDVDLTIALSHVKAVAAAAPRIAAEAAAASPAERGALPDSEPGAVRGAPLKAIRLLKTAFNVVKTVAMGILGLAMLATAVVLLYRTFVTGVNTISPVPIGGPSSVGLFAATLVIIGLAPGTFRRVWTSLIRVTVTVQTQHEREGYSSRALGERVLMDVDRRVPRFTVIPPFVRLQREPATGAISTSGLSGYAESAAELPPEISSALTTLRRRPGQTVKVELNVARGLHAPPWEALLQFAGGLRDVSIPFSCVRVERTMSSWPMPHPRLVLGVVVGDERSAQLAAAGWAPLNRLRVGPWRWRMGFETSGPRGHSTRQTIDEAARYSPVTVLHLIGRVEDTTHSLEFVAHAPADEFGRRRSLRPGDIIDRYPRIQLIVLQPEPYERWPDERSPSDREATSLMRLFAAELSGDGVPLVLVLPAMDIPYAARALAQLARLLNMASVPSTRALARTTLRIQKLVAAHPGSAIVATEACCDATLFQCRSSRTEPALPFNPPRRTDTAAPPPRASAQPRLRRS